MSDFVVAWASDEAERRGLPLTLVHAWDRPVDVSLDLAPGSLPGVHGAATSCAIHGRVAGVLLARQPELLVLGRHAGMRHLSHLTRSCLRHVACPLVVVPDVVMPPTNRVVVGMTGSYASSRALAWAADAAAHRGAALVAMNAWQLHPHSPGQLIRPAAAVTVQQSEALERLRGWTEATLGAQADVEVRAVHGGPLDVLLEASRTADLLVLGRSAHSGVVRFVNAVNDEVSGLADCPVATIPTLRQGGPT